MEHQYPFPIRFDKNLMASYLDVKVQAVLKAQKEQGALWNAGQIKYIHE